MPDNNPIYYKNLYICYLEIGDKKEAENIAQKFKEKMGIDIENQN